MKLKLLLALILATGNLILTGQTAAEAYIEKWHQVAIAEMQQYGIPASITLAQGILESGSGLSYLATEANNHFGIKCHREWDGKKVYRDDDEKNECFRAYKEAKESFRDHSLFLKHRSRYAFLFELKPTDYEEWAYGLKKAGYATDKSYPKRLIDLIERYQLHKYDLKGFQNKELSKDEYLELFVSESANRVEYVIARDGDSWERIAYLTDKKPEDLLEYNELRYDAEIEAGQVIYLQPKRRRAHRDFDFHTVSPGESMYEISQKYAVRLEKLYQRNEMYVGEQPEPGTKLELR